jgi:hypothetical protein
MADGVPAGILHLVGFIDAESTRDKELSLQATGDAVRGMVAFYVRSARDDRPLHILTGPNDSAWPPTKYIHETRKTIQHVQFTLISTLQGDQERLQRLADSVLTNANIPKSVSIEIWTRAKLDRLMGEHGSSDQVLLDLSEQDEGSQDLTPAPHPVIESGVPGGWEVYSTTFTGYQIARFYSRYRLKLLNENVRAFLQFTTKTNKAILSTIKNDPVRFVSFNNGVSIVARGAEKNFRTDSCDRSCCKGNESPVDSSMNPHDGEVDALWNLLDAQIVNGGQTTAAIYHASLDPEVRRSKAMSRVRVPVKITIVPGGEDERDDAIALIAKYSNTQNAIKPADLESNNAFFRALQNAAESAEVPIGINLGTVWFFERTRGSYAETAALGDSNWTRVHPYAQVINKYQMADVMNCLAGRPFDSQLGGDALFTRYLRWLRLESAGSKKGALPEHLFFSEAPHGADASILATEWKGVVSGVIFKRELDRLFMEKDGWMRTISARYVLALAYVQFSDQWSRIWETQDPHAVVLAEESGSSEFESRADSFAAWTRRAGDIVNEGVESARLLPNGTIRDLNYTAKLQSTWEEVLKLARTRGIVRSG